MLAPRWPLPRIPRRGATVWRGAVSPAEHCSISMETKDRFNTPTPSGIGYSLRRARAHMRMKELKLRSVPKSLAVRAVIALLATRKLVTAMRGRRPETLSVQQRALAVGELRRLVPAPRPRDLGGERIGTDTYERFLSVVARLLVQMSPHLQTPRAAGSFSGIVPPAPLHLCTSAPPGVATRACCADARG